MTTPSGHYDARRGVTRTTVQDDTLLTQAQFEHALGLILDRVTDMCDDRERKVEASIRIGIAQGFRDSAQDKQLVAEFWRQGFEEFRDRTADHASQWIGRRILTWVLVGLVSAAMVYLLGKGKLP